MSSPNQFTEKQERLLDLLVQHYFYATELQTAHSIFEREGYEQAIRYLVNEGRASARSVGGGIHPMLNYATQGDHIVAWEPGGNAFERLADLQVTLARVAKLAFPPPITAEEQDCHQMGLWEKEDETIDVP